MITWLPFAGLIALHVLFAVPGIFFMVKYWDDEFVVVNRSLFLFLAIITGVYCGLWVLGLIISLCTMQASPDIAELTAGTIDTLLFLFLLVMTGAATAERGRRHGRD